MSYMSCRVGIQVGITAPRCLRGGTRQNDVRLVDEYVQRGATLGLSALTLGNRRRELERWGCWLKRRRPRVKLEEVGGEQCLEYLRSRTRFHAKATVAGVWA